MKVEANRNFLRNIGNSFVIIENYNAKFTEWESRLHTTDSRDLLKFCKQLDSKI